MKDSTGQNVPLACVDPAFGQLLLGFDLRALDRHTGVVCGLWPDMTLAYCNAAWSTFAAANGGGAAFAGRWQLGVNLLDAISGELHGYYRESFEACMASGEPWLHGYECSSVDEFRTYHLDAYPLIHGRGLLVVHSQVSQLLRPAVDRRLQPVVLADYLIDGLVYQCSNCRRIRRILPDGQEDWHWVPALVSEPPPETVYSLCSVCREYYYPDLGSGRQAF